MSLFQARKEPRTFTPFGMQSFMLNLMISTLHSLTRTGTKSVPLPPILSNLTQQTPLMSLPSTQPSGPPIHSPSPNPSSTKVLPVEMLFQPITSPKVKSMPRNKSSSVEPDSLASWSPFMELPPLKHPNSCNEQSIRCVK